MKFGVVVFPGTWSDVDCFDVINDIFRQPVDYVWHKDGDLSAYDCIILPGGFSYGDYLRPGAIARFSPAMQAVTDFAADGGLVIGICNGFQILCEAGLLPGALLPNEHLQFRCQWTTLRVENAASPFTSAAQPGQTLRVPISHGEGNYFAEPAVIDELESAGRIAFRYADADGAITPAANPNGSLHNIAGILNANRNVLGMMPHPERCCDALLGGEDGKIIFQSIIDALSGADAMSTNAQASGGSAPGNSASGNSASGDSASGNRSASGDSASGGSTPGGSTPANRSASGDITSGSSAPSGGGASV